MLQSPNHPLQPNFPPNLGTHPHTVMSQAPPVTSQHTSQPSIGAPASLQPSQLVPQIHAGPSYSSILTQPHPTAPYPPAMPEPQMVAPNTTINFAPSSSSQPVQYSQPPHPMQQTPQIVASQPPPILSQPPPMSTHPPPIGPAFTHHPPAHIPAHPLPILSHPPPGPPPIGHSGHPPPNINLPPPTGAAPPGSGPSWWKDALAKAKDIASVIGKPPPSVDRIAPPSVPPPGYQTENRSTEKANQHQGGQERYGRQLSAGDMREEGGDMNMRPSMGRRNSFEGGSSGWQAKHRRDDYRDRDVRRRRESFDYDK